jgi:5-methyltetrahydrofolate--homocysteine methyltransferase
MDKLMPAKSAGNWDDLKGFLDEAEEAIQNAKFKIQNSEEVEAVAEATQPATQPPSHPDTTRSDAVEIDIPRPQPPFWGTKILNPEDIPLEEVFWYSGFAGAVRWPVAVPQAQGAVAGRVRRLLARNGAPDFGQWKARILAEKLLHPQIVYGYFPCLAEGNSLHIYDPDVVNEP